MLKITDPLPPKVEIIGPNCFLVSWYSAQFCGFKPNSVLDSLVYTIEVKEGVPWKEGYAFQHVHDVGSSAYKRIFSSKETFSFEINDLKCSNWYYLRLEVEYLGIKVYSEVQPAHTLRGVPTPPSIPRLTVTSVANSFDVKSLVPARFDILLNWGMSQPNGADILSYQVQLKVFDATGSAKSLEPRRNKFDRGSKDAIANIISSKKNYNQWIQSRGRDSKQVETSLRYRSVSKLPSIAAEPFTNISQEPSLFGSQASLEQQQHTQQSTERSLSPGNGHDSPSRSSGWRIIYNNINRRLRIDPPERDDFAWGIRVRSRNSEGWSPFSETLLINGLTHPSLFRLPALSYSMADERMADNLRRRPQSSPARFSHISSSLPLASLLAHSSHGDNRTENESLWKVANHGFETDSQQQKGSNEMKLVPPKNKIEEKKESSIAFPKKSSDPVIRGKKGSIHFSPESADDSEAVENPTADIPVRPSKRGSFNGGNVVMKNGKPSLQRSSSIGTSSSAGSKADTSLVPEQVLVTQKRVNPSNRLLDVLIPFNDWK